MIYIRQLLGENKWRSQTSYGNSSIHYHTCYTRSSVVLLCLYNYHWTLLVNYHWTLLLIMFTHSPDITFSPVSDWRNMVLWSLWVVRTRSCELHPSSRELRSFIIFFSSMFKSSWNCDLFTPPFINNIYQHGYKKKEKSKKKISHLYIKIIIWLGYLPREVT